jgi:hypothetical protein
MPPKIGGLVQCVGQRADFDLSDALEDLARANKLVSWWSDFCGLLVQQREGTRSSLGPPRQPGGPFLLRLKKPLRYEAQS